MSFLRLLILDQNSLEFYYFHVDWSVLHIIWQPGQDSRAVRQQGQGKKDKEDVPAQLEQGSNDKRARTKQHEHLTRTRHQRQQHHHNDPRQTDRKEKSRTRQLDHSTKGSTFCSDRYTVFCSCSLPWRFVFVVRSFLFVLFILFILSFHSSFVPTVFPCRPDLAILPLLFSPWIFALYVCSFLSCPYFCSLSVSLKVMLPL